ncbi:NmrA family protein [Xylaria cf. heliscus]|nr:NmrA family protein [Xylaria cf. heliscus]
MATYLVTQATGNQSQWTIKHLLAAGQKVHAIVRDPSKIPDTLKRPGVTVFKGESVNFDDVFSAAQGCVGVFLNTFPIPGVELQQAKTILEASKKAGLKSVVASTVMLAAQKAVWDDAATVETNLLDYFRSKAAVEDAVRGAGLEAWTILRPAFCHFDYMVPSAHGNFARLAEYGELDHYYDDGVRMPQTDANDIGKYAAAALQDPAKFAGQGIDIASENLTIEEVRDALVRVTGRDVGVRRRTPEDGEPVSGQRFQQWANFKDFTSVMQGAKEAQAKFGIPFTPFEEALQRDKSRLLESFPIKA